MECTFRDLFAGLRLSWVESLGTIANGRRGANGRHGANGGCPMGLFLFFLFSSEQPRAPRYPKLFSWADRGHEVRNHRLEGKGAKTLLCRRVAGGREHNNHRRETF